MPITISGSTGISGVDGTVASPAVQGADTNTGIYYPAADQVAIATGGVQRLLVDATGTVTTGVGALYPLVSGTAVASTSGTSIDFTGIPSWVKRVTVMFNGVSTNGTSVRQIQLGDSGGVEITGYTGSVATTNSAGTGNNAAFAGAGFALQNSGNTLAADTLYGNVVFTNVSGNIWVGTGILVASNAPASFYISGGKTLSDVLTQVRITTVGGTDTFDAGSINILYEG